MLRRLALVAGLCGILSAGEPSARALLRKGGAAEKRGNLAEAVLLYNQAAARGAIGASARAAGLRERMLRDLPAAPAAAAALPQRIQSTAEPDPALFAPITDRDLKDARELLPPPDLALPDKTFTVDWRQEPQKAWEELGRLLGLEVLFDADYASSGRPLRYQSVDQSARQLLQGLSTATGSFVVPLAPRRIMVVKDTVQKRQEREPTVAVVLSLPDPTSTQELQEAARAVQQVMEIQKFAIDNTRRMVLMRDRVSKVRPAQKLFEQLLGARPSVLVELELYEVRRTGNIQAGVGLPTSSKLFWLSRFLNNDPDKVDPGAPMATIGAGNGLIGMTIADATVTATALKSYGASLQRAFLQSVSGQPAQLLLGEKYPILTAGYFGAPIGEGEQAFTPPPSFQFENLGLTMKVTPFVHDAEEMTLEVEAEFKLLTGAEINGIPILANRKFNSRVRMRDGQWALMGGLNQDSRTFNATGIPGLMQIPGIGPVFRRNSLEVNDGQMLLVLRPRLLGAGTDLVPDAIHLGTESRPSIPF